MLGAGLGVACAANHVCRVDTRYTPLVTQSSNVCRRPSTTYLVPEVPVADTVLGDMVVECSLECQRDYAEAALLQLAQRNGAAHVSSMSCVQQGRRWLCVGRASAPTRCDEGA